MHKRTQEKWVWKQKHYTMLLILESFLIITRSIHMLVTILRGTDTNASSHPIWKVKQLDKFAFFDTHTYLGVTQKRDLCQTVNFTGSTVTLNVNKCWWQERTKYNYAHYNTWLHFSCPPPWTWNPPPAIAEYSNVWRKQPFQKLFYVNR